MRVGDHCLLPSEPPAHSSRRWSFTAPTPPS